MKPRVLVVAGLDPSCGAGLLADADAVRAGGALPLLCASALTVQTTRAVRAIRPLEPEWISRQVLALLEEEPAIGAVKLGMLGSAAAAEALGALLEHPLAAGIPWVVDPVLRSSSGAALIDAPGAEAYAPLYAARSVFTPNLMEAGELAAAPTPEGPAQMEACAGALLRRGVGAVLVKGGHLAGAPFDLLVREEGVRRFEGERVEGSRRGTGCRLGSFLAARLALGVSLEEAARDAKTYVAAYLRDG